jgi:hypothetical protein
MKRLTIDEILSKTLSSTVRQQLLRLKAGAPVACKRTDTEATVEDNRRGVKLGPQSIVLPDQDNSILTTLPDAGNVQKYMKKVPDDIIARVYSETKSVWKTAKIVGLCGQSVHERATKLGIIKSNWLSKEDEDKIRRLYSEGFLRGDGKLNQLAQSLGRTKQLICRKARLLGLTTTGHRPASESLKKDMAVVTITRWKNQEHPRGALGYRHTKATLSILSQKSSAAWDKKTPKQISERTLKMMRTKSANGTLFIPRQKCTWKQGWRVIVGIRKYYRSIWEANYARYLEFLKLHGDILEWQHEPETFWFDNVLRGCRSYLPDFKVKNKDGSIEYHEVKGWMDKRSATKLKRMKKYHPQIHLVLIEAKQYREIKDKLSRLIDGWEAKP